MTIEILPIDGRKGDMPWSNNIIPANIITLHNSICENQSLNARVQCEPQFECACAEAFLSSSDQAFFLCRETKD